ncbi:pilus assembly protein [Baekduia soli]|uniref:Pilus assembly protein n=1 Tax=Baekduia soli TaxID=496014 RepID=A0A5B8U4G3_9ACTN|nr:pilus assembly protein [Baekduia soli]QEC47841.1 pilus assembly protein [Baekduia soli]
MPRSRAQEGQATVELLGLLPVLALVALALWQAVLAGQAAWLAGGAAREAARARALGADPEPAARRALPADLRRGLRVTRDGGDGVRVRVTVPVVVGHRGALGSVGARARMEPQA